MFIKTLNAQTSIAALLAKHEFPKRPQNTKGCLVTMATTTGTRWGILSKGILAPRSQGSDITCAPFPQEACSENVNKFLLFFATAQCWLGTPVNSAKHSTNCIIFLYEEFYENWICHVST